MNRQYFKKLIARLTIMLVKRHESGEYDKGSDSGFQIRKSRFYQQDPKCKTSNLKGLDSRFKGFRLCIQRVWIPDKRVGIPVSKRRGLDWRSSPFQKQILGGFQIYLIWAKYRAQF